MNLFSDYVMTVDGKTCASAATVDVINPATGLRFANAPAASTQHLDAAVAAAQAAFVSWGARPIEERRALLIQAAEAIKAHAGDFAQLFVREQGRPLEAARGEILLAASWLKAVARQNLPVEVAEDTPTRRVEIHHEPLGVIGAIVPW